MALVDYEIVARDDLFVPRTTYATGGRERCQTCFWDRGYTTMQEARDAIEQIRASTDPGAVPPLGVPVDPDTGTRRHPADTVRKPAPAAEDREEADMKGDELRIRGEVDVDPGLRKLLLDYLTALDSLDTKTQQVREQEEIVRRVREELWARLSDRGLMDTSIWVAEWLVWVDEHGDVHRRRVLRIP